MPVKLPAIARERERSPAVMHILNSVLKHGQGKQTKFTIDFTFYKVLIIMLCLWQICALFLSTLLSDP